MGYSVLLFFNNARRDVATRLRESCGRFGSLICRSFAEGGMRRCYFVQELDGDDGGHVASVGKVFKVRIYAVHTPRVPYDLMTSHTTNTSCMLPPPFNAPVRSFFSFPSPRFCIDTVV